MSTMSPREQPAGDAVRFVAQSSDVTGVFCVCQHERLIARASAEGLWLWCKGCRQERCLGWVVLFGVVFRLLRGRDAEV